MHKIGKKRERCIELLEDLGIIVSYCKPNRGYWSHAKQDVFRWEWGGTFKGISVSGGCWYSMTECAKSPQLVWDRKTDEVYPIKESKQGL